MQYLDQEGAVVYKSKDGETTKDFPALEWLAAIGKGHRSSFLSNRVASSCFLL
jgi:hypothetical protein